MLYILDRNEQVVGLLQSNSDRNKNIYYDDVLTEILSSGADTFTFTSIPDKETSRKLTVGNYIAFKKDNKFKLLQIIEVNENKEDVLTKEVYCEGAGLELINTVYSGSKMDAVNVERFLKNILQDTNWKVGHVSSNLTKTLSLDVEEKEVYSIIQEYLYDFEAEIDFRVEIKGNRIVGRYIDVYSKRGRNNGRRLEINRDIKGITRKVSLANYATKLIGEGKNGLNFRDISMTGTIEKPLGQNFVVNEEAYSRLNNKGKHITRKFTYDTEDAYELLRQTHKALKEYSEPKVTYEVDVDILDFDDIEIGDYVSISDLSFTPPLLVTARISELETSKTNKYSNKAVLSNFNEVRSGISSIFPILGEDIVSGSIGEEQMNPDYVDSIISDSVNATMVKTEILLADKANIGDLNATNAEIENLKVNKAEITDLNATNANIDNLKANFAEIDELLAGNITAENIKADSITSDHIQANTIDTKHLKADSIDANKIKADSIESKHIQSNTIDTNHLKADIIDAEHINANSITSNHIQSNTIDARHINSNSINADHIQANTITSGHIQTGSITAGSGIIADGAIGNAQISQIDAGKIEAGTIDTSKVTIQGANGHLRLKGNRMQVFQGTGNQAKERVSVGDVNGNGTVYGLRVRGADGQTILLDENGVKSEGITNGAITNDKISDNAEIDGAKLNINSVVTEINDNGTEVIKGTKISVNGTNLETKLSTIESTQTTHGNTISQHSSKISANEKAISFKVDSQTYTTDKENMVSKLDKNTSDISVMKGQIALKVEQTDIETAKNEINNSIDTKINSINSKVSEIKTDLNGITSRVGSVESKQTTTDGKVTGLESRMSNAESKITENAITNTVKKNFYTKSETDSQITSKGYQTSSQVQQTVNGLQVKIEQSGGYNNLLNSQFRKGTSYWSPQIYGTATNNSITTWDDSNQYILPNTKAIVIRGTNVTDRYGVHQSVKVKGNTTYSIFALSAGHRNTKQVLTVRRADNGGHLLNIEVDPINAGKNISSWRKMKGTFTVPADITEITVCLYLKGNGTNNDAYAWFTNVTLTEGQLVEEWSPHPSEVYDGITTIDKDGVTVTSSNVKSKTSMTSSGFKITKTDTNEDVFKVNADGTLYMKGQITVTGGSVPTSNLSGTISSNQLNSTITNDISTAKNNASNAVSTANTAKSTADSAKSTATSAQSTANTASTNATNALNTANSVNSTVNSNKNNWSNAYNRVKEWASGAVTGSTTINGGMITANTISVNKLAVGDFTNISQIDENLAPNGNTVITHSDNYKYFRFGNDSSAGYHSLYFATLNGGTFKVGDRFKFTFIGFGNKSISTAFIIRARYTDNTWNNLGHASYTFDTANKTRTVELQITSGLTAGKTLQRVQIFNEFSNTTGLVYMRNICINRMATGELIVDGSIKTSMIHSDGLNASVIKAGTISADRLDANTIVSKVNGGTTEINGNRIQTGTLSASKITTGTLDASKVTVTNLNASNIKSGKLSANYIDATNLSVKGELLSGQINGVGGMKFADGAVISSCESGVGGYKGIQISAPVIKLGDKVEINRPTIFYDVTGKNDSSSKTTTWTMSSSGGLNCSTITTSSTTTVGGTLNVRNNMINGMNNLQMGRGSVNIPIFGTNYTYDYIKGGASRIAFADNGPIHFLYNGTRSSFVAGGTVYLPHAGHVNCDHFRLGAGIMACPSSGSFHFLTASGNTSPLYAGRLYSADVLYLNEPMTMSNNSVFDKINSVNVIETKNGLNLHNPISTTNDIDESPDVVKTVYNEEKDEIKTSIDYTSAISTLWKAVQELKQENDELKEKIKDIYSKL